MQTEKKAILDTGRKKAMTAAQCLVHSVFKGASKRRADVQTELSRSDQKAAPLAQVFRS
jgi:hypothetical protein